jgi:hypothetical protein
MTTLINIYLIPLDNLYAMLQLKRKKKKKKGGGHDDKLDKHKCRIPLDNTSAMLQTKKGKKKKKKKPSTNYHAKAPSHNEGLF